MNEEPDEITSLDEIDRGNPLAAVMDEDEPGNSEYRDEAIACLNGFELRFARQLVRLRFLATDCLLFANHYGHLIGCYSQTDIVKRHKGDPSAKANVNKWVKSFQRQIRLPDLVGQRDATGRRNIYKARKSQLKQNL